jgi:hypothetical protein
VSKKAFSFLFSFVLLCDVLCDPLWFNGLAFTTKALKGFHEGTLRGEFIL